MESVKKETISLLIKSLLQERLSLKTSACIVIFVGVFPNLFSESQRPFDPFLPFLVPAWVFSMIGTLWHFVRTPNKSDWEAALGLSYALRKKIVKHYLIMKTAEGVVVILLGVILFSAVRILRMEVLKIDISLSIALLTAFLTPGIILCSIIIYTSLDLLPKKNDKTIRMYSNGLSAFNATLRTGFSCISRCASAPFPRKYKALVRRLVLYILRKNLLESFLALCFGIFICGITAALNNTSSYLVTFTVLMYMPLLNLYILTPCMSEASGKIRACDYYAVDTSRCLVANVGITLLVIVPYLLLLIVTAIRFTDSSLLLFLVKGMILYSLHGIIFSNRWITGRWTSWNVTAVISHVFITYVISVLDLSTINIALIIFLYILYFAIISANHYRFPYHGNVKKIGISIATFILLPLFMILMIFSIISDPVKSFLYDDYNNNNNYPFLSAVSINKYYTDNHRVVLPAELAGKWTLQYDKTAEPQPWIISDSTIHVYDEDTGKRDVLLTQSFMVNNKLYLNCSPGQKNKKVNRYVQSLNFPMNVLIKPELDSLGNLAVSVLNHETVNKIIQRDSLHMHNVFSEGKHIYSCTTDQWIDFLIRYNNEENVFQTVGYFRR